MSGAVPVVDPIRGSGLGPAPASELGSWLSERTEEMVELLVRLARAESPSADRAAQREPLSMIATELEQLGFEVGSIPGGEVGDHLVARSRWAAAGNGADLPRLLVGHIDTVWPIGTLAHMPVRSEAGRLHGPGVYDMKGGLVQAIYALRAIEALGLKLSSPVTLFVNTDEEIGSPHSREHLLGLAAAAREALVLEPSFGSRGMLKTTRKGIGRFIIQVRGNASHAGIDPEGGASAILEASHLIQSLFGLNDPTRGVTVNVGTIDGGLATNVVAPEVTATVEVRVTCAEDAAELERELHALTPEDPATRLAVEGGFDRPPLEPTAGNRALWRRAGAVASELGIEIEEASVGGASDGNLTSALIPTLDGLGAVGDGAHTEHEHVLVERLPERAALLAGLLIAAEPPEG